MPDYPAHLACFFREHIVVHKRTGGMENRVSNKLETGNKDRQGPQPIGAILAELLAQYQARFPKVHVVVVETA